MGKVKPRASARSGAPGEPLVIGLGDPGMTPLLRAGLGGLAASLRAMLLRSDPAATWPKPVPIGKGEARIEPRRVVIDWNGAPQDEVLRALFNSSFRVRTPPGVIELPGTANPARPFDIALASALQSGLKKTFLQHGKTTTKAGGTTVVSVEIDGQTVPVNVQPYSAFIHQNDGCGAVIEALKTGSVELAGWAYPGAADRHTGLSGATKCSYGPGAALCACFALVGCLSLEVPRGGGAGVLLIVEPSDLVRFAVTRPRLTPARLADAYVTGPGDAVLAVHLAMRLDDVVSRGPGVAAAHGVALRTMPWASQQKTRAATVTASSVEPARLDLYADVVRTLPNRIVRRAVDEDEADGSAGFFAATSALRAFVAENIAAGRPWFAGFARATTGGKKPRFIHYFRAKDHKNLGALYPDERNGLITMLKHLEDAEAALVRAVHIALRQRFGAIAEESKDAAPQTMRNRFNGERDRWRFAFAGARTPQQIRAALADLWSRAGPNKELKAHWELVLPLLRAEQWETARDLSLVALASYQGGAADEDEPDSTPAS
jgi:CRISPR-associated protein Cas8a1/Csx13